jgi:hypothetical protein
MGTPMYTCFVDFHKAFDSVRHLHLWDRLGHYGVGGNFLRCVQSIYQQSQACVTVNGAKTGFVPLAVGVRQGDPLSPVLFGLYIETLAADLEKGMAPADSFMIGHLPVFLLLYADDIVLVASSPGALQRELDLLGTFCADWDLTVNLSKTQIVVFNPKPSDKRLSWALQGAAVEVAQSYKYLGLVFDAKKGLSIANSRQIDCGRKALFAMMGACSRHDIDDPSIQRHMFSTLVLPSLSYGAELWGSFAALPYSADYFKLTAAEKVHRTFLRWHTGVGPGTHNSILLELAGGRPLSWHWIERIVSFWNRAMRMDASRLVCLAFQADIALMQAGAECWAARVVAQFVGLGVLGASAPLDAQVPLCERLVSAGVALDERREAFWASYQVSPRSLPSGRHVPQRTLYTFASWFLDLLGDTSTHHGVPRAHWQRVLRFAGGCHQLLNIQARWGRTVVGMCPSCGAHQEDELHFVLECPAYLAVRAKHAVLFRGALPADSAAMHTLFQRKHFVGLSKFLRDCLLSRDTYINAA